MNAIRNLWNALGNLANAVNGLASVIDAGASRLRQQLAIDGEAAPILEHQPAAEHASNASNAHATKRRPSRV